MSPPGSVLVHVAGRTDVGLVREHNEDNFVVVDLASGTITDVTEMHSMALSPKGMVLLVCDGMGGAAAGEIASALAVETICSAMSSTGEPEGVDRESRKIGFARRLRSAAYTANERIFDAARRDLTKVGMGTTMTAVGIFDGNLVIAQVGDSRAYLLREGVLAQLTRDQSLVNELLETGQITEEQAAMFEHSNVILQALGVQQDVEVLLSTVELRQGDRLVVCSDGLTGVVADEELGALAAVSDDVTEACRLLIEMARGGGGPDNITAIVARFDGDVLEAPTAEGPPVSYIRWRLDEPAPSTPAGGSRAVSPHAETVRSRATPPHTRRKPDAARIFFSAMVLFALAMGSLILASALFRSAPAQKCRVSAAPGLAIRVDGLDTGAHTRPDGVELRLPMGRHRITLRGHNAPAAEQAVDVTSGTACAARFEGAE